MSADLVPTLTTARLTMRAGRNEDLDAYASMASDPAVTRYIGGLADRAQAWRHLAQHLGHWVLRGYGTWILERRSDGELVGRVGLWNPEGWPGLEVGWTLVRHAWEQGYATEAARAAIDWAWTNLDTPRLISLIHRDNEASMRVARRLGELPERNITLEGNPVTIFVIDRPPDR